MKRKVVTFLVLFSLLVPLGHNADASSREIIVSAAISLKDAFTELGRLYEQKNSDVIVAFNFGASGNLAGQIEGGAPADVFASASQKYMDAIESKGLLLNDTRSNFAANGIVLIGPSGSKAASLSFRGLRGKEIRQVAVGNPEIVPAGRYAMQVLAYYKLLPSIRDELVFGENVRQVLDYVSRGEVDAGIVYSTDASVRTKEVRIEALAPEKSHEPVIYPIAVMKGTKNEADSKGFVSFVLSPEGQGLLEKYGFKKP